METEKACWNKYSEKYNLCADKLLEAGIDVNILKNTIDAYKEYEKCVMLNKVRSTLTDLQALGFTNDFTNDREK